MAGQAHFPMENIILPMILAERCTSILAESQAIELMKYVDDINMEYGGEGTKLYSTAGTKFKKLCLQNKLNLLDASVRHLGTDINYVVSGKSLCMQLKDKVDFYFDTPVQKVEVIRRRIS